jgi:hypothetical protein
MNINIPYPKLKKNITLSLYTINILITIQLFLFFITFPTLEESQNTLKFDNTDNYINFGIISPPNTSFTITFCAKRMGHYC